MLYKYGTVNEVYESAARFPSAVATELLTCTVILDAEYGEDRDYEESNTNVEMLKGIRYVISYHLKVADPVWKWLFNGNSSIDITKEFTMSYIR